MTVKKTVKTGSDVNPKTKCRFWLILIPWAWMYAYLVHLTKKDRLNIRWYWFNCWTNVARRKIINKMTECIVNALTFLFPLFLCFVFVLVQLVCGNLQFCMLLLFFTNLIFYKHININLAQNYSKWRQGVISITQKIKLIFLEGKKVKCKLDYDSLDICILLYFYQTDITETFRNIFDVIHMCRSLAKWDLIRLEWFWATGHFMCNMTNLSILSF